MTDSKPRVLVVDDDRAVRDSLRRSLEFNGYEVVLAADCAEGLVAVGAAVATTPVGAQWFDEWFGELWSWLRTIVADTGWFG